MENQALTLYLPPDRLISLARGEILPDRAAGSALFADISGFTSMTEKMTQTLGVRRGTEELTQLINRVYDVLIGCVEQYGGSVISFAGDAITCWFDANPQNSSTRALAAASLIQTRMATFEALSVKITVTSGRVRRFAVGDPTIHRLDVLSGTTIGRLSVGETLAQPGEILAEEATIASLGTSSSVVKAWRVAENGERFAVMEIMSQQITPAPSENRLTEMNPETLRPWLLPAVYAREMSGHGAFLTELRPVVALFLRFGGIDYDQDEHAGDKLDAFIRRAQQIVTRFEGTLLQLSFGDKGSYFYAAFGAPVAHENDAVRAVQAALALREIPAEFSFIQPVQIGMSSGIMRTGAYGGSTRRTYGALGDETNLAARLMMSAAPGEILVSERVQTAGVEGFTIERRAPLLVKGKAEPQAIFAVTGERRGRAIRLGEPAYTLPMVGRQAELALIEAKLQQAVQGQGQVIGITTEAGMGKSRLVAEVVRAARQSGFICLGGASESSGTNTAYLVWKPIWQAFFDLDPQMPLEDLVRHVDDQIAERAPMRREAIPLLAPLFDVALDDNDYTRALEPKDRRSVLTALLEDCLKSAAREMPLLLVLEDLHWIDPLSHDLLEALARASVTLPISFVLAYRPSESLGLPALRVEAMPHFTRVSLDPLSAADTEQLIRAKLAQWFPEPSSDLLPVLVQRLNERAEGNPFYIEELLNYLHDHDISPYDETAVRTLELPSSLHTLILSRIDQMTEPQQASIKTASIIGRLFRVVWLHGYYPPLGNLEQIKTNLIALAQADLTRLDAPEPELAYLFKHVVTQEVAYESLSYATRTQLHEYLAQFIETLGANTYLDLLAYHYGHSSNTSKQREYFRKAGDAAKAAYANEAALDYYARLLPLLADIDEQIEVYLHQGEISELIGRWDEADSAYRAALALAEQQVVPSTVARIQLAFGQLNFKRGDHPAALNWLEMARTGFIGLNDEVGQGQALTLIGRTMRNSGDTKSSTEVLEQGLALARAHGDADTISTALYSLGTAATQQGDLAGARTLIEESISLQRAGSKEALAAALVRLAIVYYYQADRMALTLLEESLALRREIGDKQGVAETLGFLGQVTLTWVGSAAVPILEESVALRREMGDKQGLARALGSLMRLLNYQGTYAATWTVAEEGLALSRELGDDTNTSDVLALLAIAVAAQGDFEQALALAEESLTLAEKSSEMMVAFSKMALGYIEHQSGHLERARELYQNSLSFFSAAGEGEGIAEIQSYLGDLAIDQGNYAEARTAHREALLLSQTLHEQRTAGYPLVGLSAVLLSQSDDPVRAVQLLANGNQVFTRLGAKMGLIAQRIYDQQIGIAQSLLGGAAFQTAWDEGERLTLDGARALALEATSPSESI
ncbi:MAG: adenylate/guanylate cyclase domain-containing protein [Chloroflexota bacterium]